jgi:AraC-like DNA-binding protein
MMSEGMDVTAAGFQVGYESASQCSGEYSRHFGSLPTRHLAKLRSFAWRMKTFFTPG